MANHIKGAASFARPNHGTVAAHDDRTARRHAFHRRSQREHGNRVRHLPTELPGHEIEAGGVETTGGHHADRIRVARERIAHPQQARQRPGGDINDMHRVAAAGETDQGR